jgi:photosystem II stability/assembly factor-like uncharacterized protein
MKKTFYLIVLSTLLLSFNSCLNNDTKKSSDFEKLDIACDYNLYSVSFINEDIGFVGGGDQYNHVLFKTTDGGITWDNIYIDDFISPIDNSVDAICFTSENIGYLMFGIDAYKTSDQGETWNKMDGFFQRNLQFSCVDTGFTHNSDSEAKIYYTFDGGKNWDRYPEGTFKSTIEDGDLWIEGVQFLNNNSRIGFAFDQNGEIFITRDGGQSWEIYNKDWIVINKNNYGGYPVKAMFFISELEGFIFNDEGIFKTTNGCESFTLINPLNMNINNQRVGGDLKISYPEGNNIYFLGNENIYKTENQFIKNSKLSVEDLNNKYEVYVEVYNFTMASNKIGYAVGYESDEDSRGGTVLKYSK